MKIEDLRSERQIIGRLLFSFYLVSLLYRFFQQVTPSQMLQPVLFRYNFDFTYWVFDLAGIFDLVMQSRTGSIVFDILLFSSCLLCIRYPLKYYWAIIFGILFFIYAVCFNTYIVQHSHQLAFMTLAIVPFFFKNSKHWRILWEGFRYYVCYAYFISFCWKAFWGKSMLSWNMGVNSTKSNLVEYLYHYPDRIISEIFHFFIAHPYLLNIGLIVVFVLEGIMIVGFFTKRFDFLLIWIPLIIHLTTYFFTDVFFAEMLVGMFAFISFKAYAQLGEKLPVLKLQKTIPSV